MLSIKHEKIKLPCTKRIKIKLKIFTPAKILMMKFKLTFKKLRDFNPTFNFVNKKCFG